MPARGRAESAQEIVAGAAAHLNGTPDLAATLQGIAAAARSALGADRATCYVHDTSQIVSAVHTTETDPARRAFLEGALGLGTAELPILDLQHSQADPLLVVEDVRQHPTISPRLAGRLGSGAFLGVRLEHASVQAGGAPALLGTLFCNYGRPRRFTAAERLAAQGLANLAVLALANARLQAATAQGLEENRALAAEQAALRRVATHVAAEAGPEAVFAQAAEEVAGLLGVECGAVVRFADPQQGALVGVWAAEAGAGLDIGTIVPLSGESATARVFHTGKPALMRDYAGLDEQTEKLLAATPYRSGVAAPIRVGGRMWGAIGALTSRPELLPEGCEQRLANFGELVGVAIANAEARARLTAQAASDPLTGLANHRAFFEGLHAEAKRARRHGHPLSLVVIDLDHFKRVNDTHGHPVGDRVLVEVAERLRAVARAGGPLGPGRRRGVRLAAARDRGTRCLDRGRAGPAGHRRRALPAGGAAHHVGRSRRAGDRSERQRTRSRRRRRPLLGQGPGARRLCALRPRARAADGRPPHRHLSALGPKRRGPARPGPRAARSGIRRGGAVSGRKAGVALPGRRRRRLRDQFGGEIPLDETYCQRVVQGRLPNLIRDARNEERVRDLALTQKAGIGAYAGMPIILPGGDLYGTLCCLSPRAEPALGERDVRLLRILAGTLGEELEREQRGTALEREQRERISRLLGGEMLTVVLQPIVELAGGRVVAAEALSRFPAEPRRSPAAWFAEAAAVGLGMELELVAIRAALAHLDALPAGVRLSLNVSPAVLLAPELVGALAAVRGERLALELTEHAPVEDYRALEVALDAYRSRGVQLMIDDAGAGFASLRHVVGLRPDSIKLDLSLTRDIDSDPVRRALAASLVAFAREIGATMVAEGIETRAELEAVRALGVTHAQGFYLARPGPGPVPGWVALGDAAPALVVAR